MEAEAQEAIEAAAQNPVTKAFASELFVSNLNMGVNALLNAASQHFFNKPITAIMTPATAQAGVLQSGAQVAGTPNAEVEDIDKMIAELNAKKEAALAKEAAKNTDALDEDEKLAVRAVRHLKSKGVKDAGKMALAGCYMLEEYLGHPMVDGLLKKHLERVEKELADEK
ncbi:MAG: hypothetical protein AAGJ18_31240 [Bacteroidota bacterium]